MAEIILSRGYVALVDDVDVRPGPWHASIVNGRVYACQTFRNSPEYDGPVRKRYLHREIAGVGWGAVVKFRDGDSLNCRRANLRVLDGT